MKRQILLFALLVVCGIARAQVTVNIQWYVGPASAQADTIHYDPGHTLVWKDFKGKPDMNSGAAAITESGFGYRMGMRSVNGRMQIDIMVYCYFNKRRSWVKAGMNTAYALTHEQHHFDITWINTCDFVQKLKAARFTASNYQTTVDAIYDACYESLRTMQDAYDGQTDNGRNKPMQAAWNSKIETMLSQCTRL